MPAVTVNGVRLNYYVGGKGKPVICVHGVLGSSRQWKYLVSALESDGEYRAYALDLRGFGDSDKPRGGYDLATFVEDLRSFMDAMNIQKATLIGSSLGLIIVASFAVKYPDRIERLVLVGNAAHVPSTPKIVIGAFFSPLLFMMRRMTGKWLAQQFFSTINDKTRADFDEFVADIMRTPVRAQIKSLKAGMGVDLREDVSRMNVPVMGVFTALDRMVSLDQAEAMRRCIKIGKVEVIEGSGHTPMLEQPEKFNEVVLAFLKDGSGSSR
jgi:pimeloyl-ACP methyl ester carboxylesterase